MQFQFPSGASSPDALASIVLVTVLLIGWWITGRSLRISDDLSSQAAQRWTANVRNALLLIAVAGLLMIWAPQLRTFALSLTAVAVAIVIATKELILCLSGSAYRTFSQSYNVGDMIEVGTHKGIVTQISLLSTTLSEFDRDEGSIRPAQSSVTIPHSLFFSAPARLLAKKGAPTEHKFQLYFEPDFDLFSQLDDLQKIAANACAAHASASASAGARHSDGDGDGDSDSDNSDQNPATTTPTITVTTTNLCKLKLDIQVRVEPANASIVERFISEKIGAFVMAQRTTE